MDRSRVWKIVCTEDIRNTPQPIDRKRESVMGKGYVIDSLNRRLEELRSVLDENKKRAEFYQQQRDESIVQAEQLQKNIESVQQAIDILNG